MVKCSICKCEGHNRRTCPKAGESSPEQNKKVKKTKKAKKLSELKSLDLSEAEKKLEKIQKNRKEQYEIANECAESLMKGKNASIKAEEKTGKRTILEAIHLIMIVNHFSNVPDKRVRVPKSVYVTGLNRKDTKPQFEEQEEEYGILSVSSRHDKLLGDIVNILNDKNHDGMIYIHIDECDFGTGEDQSLSRLFCARELQLIENKERIKFVAYSATIEELEYSGVNPDEWDFHEFIPSDSYFGAKKYIDRGLVYEPKTFFDGKKITEHGESIIEEVTENCCSGCPIDTRDQGALYKCQRNVVVVRDTTPKNLGYIREKKDRLSKKHKCMIYIFDQTDGFEWGNSEKWAELGREIIQDDNMCVTGYSFQPVLIFISQICTRSTELCPLGHRKIFAWHDARTLQGGTPYNTISQAIGRVKHYTQEGHPENTIKLYCDINVLNFRVGEDLDTDTIVLGQRIKTKKEKQNKVEFVKYEDGYGNDPNTVPDWEWQHDDPTIGRNGQFIEVNGKWCHKDGKLRVWGDRPPGSGGNAGKQTVLQYKDRNSDSFMIRTAIYKKNSNPSGGTKFSYSTKSNSMYAGIPGIPEE